MKKLNLTVLLAFLIVANICLAQKVADFSTLPKVKWKMQLGPVFGSPLIDNGTVYCASQDGFLHAIDLQQGTEKWKFDLHAPSRSTPAIDKDNLYVISESGVLVNINKNTGKQIWQFSTPQGTLLERKYDRADYFQSSPTIAGDKIYFGMGDYIYAVNLSNGTLAWNFKTGNVVHTKPAISNDKVIFGSYDGNVYALATQTGLMHWKFKTVGQRFFPNGEVMGNPVVIKNQVFVGARDYNFYAIDANSGYCNWNRQFPRGWALAATALRDSMLYLGTSDDYVMIAMDPRSGTEAWRASVKYNIFGGMATSSSMGYFGTLMGRLYAVDLKTGAVKWMFEGESTKKNKDKYFGADDKHLDAIIPSLYNFDNFLKLYADMGGIFSTPAINGNAIVHAGADGVIYCLER
ncbi:MAG TPA: PQQ-binding-like beta-propeller repeat protein [Cyclobacteriaceae bacterium]|nr:PQQ-binding-like beta-propeller repeat protein [Cyclobacteriaceae bacterium]